MLIGTVIVFYISFITFLCFPISHPHLLYVILIFRSSILHFTSVFNCITLPNNYQLYLYVSGNDLRYTKNWWKIETNLFTYKCTKFYYQRQNSLKICKFIYDTGYTKVHLRGLMELHYHLMVGPLPQEKDPVIIVFKWPLIKVGKMLYVTRKMHLFAKLFDQVNIFSIFHKSFPLFA